MKTILEKAIFALQMDRTSIFKKIRASGIALDLVKALLSLCYWHCNTLPLIQRCSEAPVI